MVSAADRDAEAMIQRVLREQRPDDGLLGEEGGRERASSGRRWVVDPLDGTVNFIFGIPQWCVSVAVRDERGVLAGVVYDPNRDELFTAASESAPMLARGESAERLDRSDASREAHRRSRSFYWPWAS